MGGGPGRAARPAEDNLGGKSMAALIVGSPAPDFRLEGTGGQSVHLGALKGKKQVVLAFYPKDFTSG
jgi:thioredoxin-dependent peroxiredoxin